VPGIRFQLLCAGVDIRYDDPGLAPYLDYITVGAGQAVPELVGMNYSVRGRGPWEVFEEERLAAGAATAMDVQYHLYLRIYRRVLERYVLAGWVGLHGALVNIHGRRLLLLGDKGAGKSTLTSKLLFAGHPIEGDEMVLVRDGQVMALPRRLHLKPGIETQVPELVPLLENLPASWAGEQQLRGLDPTALGLPWVIHCGRVDHIVWLRPNHGGDTRLSPMSSMSLIQRLMEAYLGWGESRSGVFGCCAGLARHGGHELLQGQPDEAIALLAALAEK